MSQPYNNSIKIIYCITTPWMLAAVALADYVIPLPYKETIHIATSSLGSIMKDFVTLYASIIRQNYLILAYISYMSITLEIIIRKYGC